MMTFATRREEIVLWRCFFLIEFPPSISEWKGIFARKPYFLMVQPMVALRFSLEFSIPDPWNTRKDFTFFRSHAQQLQAIFELATFLKCHEGEKVHLDIRPTMLAPFLLVNLAGGGWFRLPLSHLEGSWRILTRNDQWPARQCPHCGGSDLSAIWSQLEHLSGGRLLCALLPGMWLPSALLFCLSSGPQGQIRETS